MASLEGHSEEIYIYIKGANRQAVALWPLSLQVDSSAMAPIVYRQAAALQGLIVSQRQFRTEA